MLAVSSYLLSPYAASMRRVVPRSSFLTDEQAIEDIEDRTDGWDAAEGLSVQPQETGADILALSLAVESGERDANRGAQDREKRRNPRREEKSKKNRQPLVDLRA